MLLIMEVFLVTALSILLIRLMRKRVKERAKKILRHALWGGFFGLLGGIIVSYGNALGGSIYHLITISFSPSWGTLAYEKYSAKVAFLPKPFPEPVQLVLYFLIPGIFLGFSLGIAGKSLKKFFYAVFGGLAGGLISYFALQIGKRSIVLFFIPLISPLICSVVISLMMGVMYKSFHKAFRAFIGGLIAWLIITPGLFFLWFFSLLALWPTGGTADTLLGSIIMSLLIFFLNGIALPTGIFIGLEKEEKATPHEI